MARKSFLSRVDGGHAISTSSKSIKDADHLLKSLNEFCGSILQFMVQRLPGMHNVKVKKGSHSKKRKHKGIVGRFL